MGSSTVRFKRSMPIPSDTDLANIFTQAQSCEMVNYDTLSVTTTPSSGFYQGRTIDYSRGNIFRKTLSHVTHALGSPYQLPVPIGMPDGYQWTVIFTQDSFGGGYVQLPALGPSGVYCQIFPTNNGVGIGLAPNQITLIHGFWSATIGKFVCAAPIIYNQ